MNQTFHLNEMKCLCIVETKVSSGERHDLHGRLHPGTGLMTNNMETGEMEGTLT